jgi:hypothetical protein
MSNAPVFAMEHEYIFVILVVLLLTSCSGTDDNQGDYEEGYVGPNENGIEQQPMEQEVQVKQNEVGPKAAESAEAQQAEPTETEEPDDPGEVLMDNDAINDELNNQDSDEECQMPSPNVDLYFYTSDDGADFSDGEEIYTRISVPHLFYDEAEDNYIASFQIFEEAPLCGGMGYTRVSLEGEILEDVESIDVDADYYSGFDPTLVTVNDQLVSVYTVRPSGMTQPCISVAVGDDISSLVGTDIVWCSDNDDEQFMDAAAVFIDPYLYVYIASDNSMSSSSPINYYMIIDVDSWEAVETGEITGVDVFFLGSIVETDDNNCPYRFYGTYKGFVRSACSVNGLDFDVDEEFIVSGADPGVAIDGDGSYAMVIAQI